MSFNPPHNATEAEKAIYSTEALAARFGATTNDVHESCIPDMYKGTRSLLERRVAAIAAVRKMYPNDHPKLQRAVAERWAKCTAEWDSHIIIELACEINDAARMLREIMPHMNEMKAYASIAPKVHKLYSKLTGLAGRKSACCGVEPIPEDMGSTFHSDWVDYCPNCKKTCEVV
jgi:hypothetical protein